MAADWCSQDGSASYELRPVVPNLQHSIRVGPQFVLRVGEFKFPGWLKNSFSVLGNLSFRVGFKICSPWCW